MASNIQNNKTVYREMFTNVILDSLRCLVALAVSRADEAFDTRW